MNDVIKDKLKTLTTKPGVYIMRDENGNVIYVGKAKNLKNRVSQYFRNSPKPLASCLRNRYSESRKGKDWRQDVYFFPSAHRLVKR